MTPGFLYLLSCFTSSSPNSQISYQILTTAFSVPGWTACNYSHRIQLALLIPLFAPTIHFHWVIQFCAWETDTQTMYWEQWQPPQHPLLGIWHLDFFSHQSLCICLCWISYVILLPCHSASWVPSTINYSWPLPLLLRIISCHQHMLSSLYISPFTDFDDRWTAQFPTQIQCHTNAVSLDLCSGQRSVHCSLYHQFPTPILISASLVWRTSLSTYQKSKHNKHVLRVGCYLLLKTLNTLILPLSITFICLCTDSTLTFI